MTCHTVASPPLPPSVAHVTGSPALPAWNRATSCPLIQNTALSSIRFESVSERPVVFVTMKCLRKEARCPPTSGGPGKLVVVTPTSALAEVSAPVNPPTASCQPESSYAEACQLIPSRHTYGLRYSYRHMLLV